MRDEGFRVGFEVEGTRGGGKEREEETTSRVSSLSLFERYCILDLGILTSHT